MLAQITQLHITFVYSICLLKITVDREKDSSIRCKSSEKYHPNYYVSGVLCRQLVIQN